MSDENLAAVIEVICSVGGVPKLEPDQDFYDAGFTSVLALSLLMEMEDRFQVSIPDERFIQARTARDLHGVIQEIRKG